MDVLDVSMTSGLYPTDVHCAWQFYPNSETVSTYAPELHENTRHTVPYLYPAGKVITTDTTMKTLEPTHKIASSSNWVP